MFVIGITGPESKTRSAANELAREFPDALRTQIQPSCLARETTNQMPAWRFELHRAMSTGKVIVNDMGRANCDEILDFARSVRALSNTHHPFVFSTESSGCAQVNGVYSLETVKHVLYTNK
jgi:hypothetical protein